MKFIPKKSRLFYILLFVSLLFPVVAPDRLTPKALSVDPLSATLLTVSWGAGSVTCKTFLTSLAAGLTCLGAAWLNNKQTTTSQQSTRTLPTQDELGLQNRLLIPAHEGKTAQFIDASLELDSSVEFLNAAKSAFVLGKGISNLWGHLHGNSISQQQTPNALEIHYHNHTNEYQDYDFLAYQAANTDRFYGINRAFVGDPLWNTLSIEQKKQIANSPVLKATWNTYLGLRQHALERIARALGLTRYQVTYPVKKIIYAALSRGGHLFSPLDRPDILVSAIHKMSHSPTESKRMFELMFAKNGVLTSISGTSPLRNLVVNSSIFDSKNSGLLIALNQLGSCLIRNEIEVSDYAMSRLTSWLHDALRVPPVYDQETSRSMFVRSCKALIRSDCKVLLNFPDVNTRNTIRDTLDPRRLIGERSIVQGAEKLASVVDGCTFTPKQQQKVEVCFARMVQVASDTKKLFANKHYSFAQTYMDREFSYILSDLQAVVKEAGGKSAMSNDDLDSLIDYDAHAIELITDYFTQNPNQHSSDLVERVLSDPSLLAPSSSSIVHPKSADCTQKTNSSQTEQSSSTTQEIQKTDDQTDSQSDQATHELQQALYAQAASDYQKGLDLYGDKLTDSQRTRYENRRDAFLEVHNNPNQTTEYNYTLPAESQRMLQAAGINISQFMSGSGNALERLVHHEQQQIAGKLQEYALQMPEGEKRNGVLREMLSNMRYASALQQCGLNQLSLIPIDQNWMLIDSIDQFGFGILDQLLEQYGLGCFIYDVAYGCLVKGPVNAANLIYLTVSNIPATIEAAGKLVEDKNAAIDLLCTSAARRVGSATLTLLACGVPESALKNQMAHWSEQQRTEAAACVEQAAERIRAITNNPIPTTIHAIGNHLVHDAANAGVATYNVLYGLSCMEAACETLDKDLELKLFEQGEQLLQENLPTAQQTAEFAGEMLFWHYAPGLIKKGASAAYDRLAERFVRGVEQVPRLMKHKIRYLTDAEFQVLASKPLSEALEVTILADNTIVVSEVEAATSTVASTANNTATKQTAKTAETVLTEKIGGLVSTTETVLGDEVSGVVGATKKIALSKVAESAKEVVEAAEKFAKESSFLALEGAASKEVVKPSEVDVVTKNEEPAIVEMTEEVAFISGASSSASNTIVKQSSKASDKPVASRMTPSGPKVSFAESKMIERFSHLVDKSGKQIGETITKVRVKEIAKDHKDFFEEYNCLIKEAILGDDQLLRRVKDKTGIDLTGEFNIEHLCIPKTKGQGISGYHWPCMATESILEVVSVFPNSFEAEIGVIKGSGNCARDTKSLFFPDIKGEEIKQLLLMTLKEFKFSEIRKHGVYLFSQLINGQRYAVFINKKGNIATFHPYNIDLS